MRGLTAFALGLATPAVAIAHHAPGSVGFAHHLSDPLHVGMLVLAIGAALLAAAAWRIRGQRLVRLDRSR